MRCPEAVQLDILRPCEPLPTSAFYSMLRGEGRDFEADVFELLATSIPDAVVVDRDLPPTRPGGRDPRCAGARRPARDRWPVARRSVGTPGRRARPAPPRRRLHAGDPGPRLSAARREAPQDARSQGQGRRGGCHHLGARVALRPVPPTRTPSCRPGGAGPISSSWPTTSACSRRAAMPPRWAVGPQSWAGRSGSSGTTSTCPCGDPPSGSTTRRRRHCRPWRSTTSSSPTASSVIDASVVHLSDPTAPLLAEPIAVSECDGCGWQEWCFEQMEASGDISVLPGMTIGKRRKYHARGVTTLEQLAALDSATARLIAAGVDLQHLEDKARTADPSTPVTDLLAGRPKQAERLVAEGICTVADARPPRPAHGQLQRRRPRRSPPADRQRAGPDQPPPGPPPARGRPGRRAPGRHRGRRRHGERERRLLPLGRAAQRA